jgi:hypothetical protein
MQEAPGWLLIQEAVTACMQCSATRAQIRCMRVTCRVLGIVADTVSTAPSRVAAEVVAVAANGDPAVCLAPGFIHRL